MSLVLFGATVVAQAAFHVSKWVRMAHEKCSQGRGFTSIHHSSPRQCDLGTGVGIDIYCSLGKELRRNPETTERLYILNEYIYIEILYEGFRLCPEASARAGFLSLSGFGPVKCGGPCGGLATTG